MPSAELKMEVETLNLHRFRSNYEIWLVVLTQICVGWVSQLPFLVPQRATTPYPLCPYYSNHFYLRALADAGLVFVRFFFSSSFSYLSKVGQNRKTKLLKICLHREQRPQISNLWSELAYKTIQRPKAWKFSQRGKKMEVLTMNQYKGNIFQICGQSAVKATFKAIQRP